MRQWRHLVMPGEPLSLTLLATAAKTQTGKGDELFSWPGDGLHDACFRRTLVRVRNLSGGDKWLGEPPTARQASRQT